MPGGIRLFAAPWTVARQAPLSMAFSRQEYRSQWPFPPPGDLPDLGFEPVSPALAGGFLTTEPPGKPRLESEARFFSRHSELGISVLNYVLLIS